MKYTIEWSENKTTATGKEKMDATLKDEAGGTHERVTIWGDFPNFKEIKTGHSILGDLVPAKDPKWGPTLYPIKAETPVGHPVRSPGAITKAMDRKEASIERTMDRKEDSFKISCTARDSVLCAIAEYNNPKYDKNDSLEVLIAKWRKYLWLNYEKEDKDFPPFE